MPFPSVLCTVQYSITKPRSTHHLTSRHLQFCGRSFGRWKTVDYQGGGGGRGREEGAVWSAAVQRVWGRVLPPSLSPAPSPFPRDEGWEPAVRSDGRRPPFPHPLRPRLTASVQPPDSLPQPPPARHPSGAAIRRRKFATSLSRWLGAPPRKMFLPDAYRRGGVLAAAAAASGGGSPS